MLPVAEARARILEGFAPLPSELVMLSDGLGRVLARDLPVLRDQPPVAVSSMDGYAVRAADLASGEARLHVIGAAPAGRAYQGRLEPGEAVRIFTGGPLPDGADAVVIQENARVEGDRVHLQARVEPGRFVRPRGLDLARGRAGLTAGRLLGARDLGLASLMGHVWLEVRRRPRVALLATGNELALPGTPLTDTSIVSSNSVTLAAMVRAWGGLPVDLGIARDDAAALREAVRAAAGADLLVTTGGASVGEHDLVRAALAEEGLELGFWKIAMRPGKPLIFGRLQAPPLAGLRLLGLPGNPVSAAVCAIVFLRSILRLMQGLDPTLEETRALLASPLGPNDEREEYLRASLRIREDGALLADPAPRQDSSMLAVLARADALVVRPPFAPAMEPGTPVRIVRLQDGAVSI